MKEIEVEDVKKKIEHCDPDRIEFTQHFYQRARRRNIDIKAVKQKLENREFDEVRQNNQSDSNFEYSYKVTIETENKLYEMPVYFNIPGPRILVKSVWPR